MNLLPVASIYLFALLLRLLYIFDSESLPSFRTLVPGLDSDVYWRAAALLNRPIEGLPNWELITTTSPFFVWWLSLVQNVLGESVLTYRLFLASVSPLNSVMVYLIAAKVLRNRASAAFAALLFAAAPASLHFDTIIAKPNLEMPLFVAICTLLIFYRSLAGAKKNIALTLVAAAVSVLCLVQQAMIVLLPIVCLLIWSTEAPDKRRRFVSVSIFCLTFLVMFSPARLFVNKLAGYAHSGFNIHLTFNENASGVYREIQGIPSNLFGHTFFAHLKAQVDTNQLLSPGQANYHYLIKTANYVREHPSAVAALLLRKAELFLNSTENKTEEYQPFLQSKLAILRWNPIGFGLFLLFSAFGVKYCLQNRKHHFLVVVLGLFVSTFALCLIVMPTWRYRYPAYLPLALLTAGGFCYLQMVYRSFRKTAAKKLLPDLLLAFVILLMAFREVHTQSYLERTMMHEETNLRNAAARELWLEDRSLVGSFSEISTSDPNSMNLLCLHHFYSYCFAKVSEAAALGLADETTNRWYISYEIYRGNFQEAKAYLEGLSDTNPDIYENIRTKKYDSQVVNEIMDRYVFSIP